MRHLNRSVSLLILVIILCSVAAAKKERDWKTGKLLDTGNEVITTSGGTNTQGRVNPDGTYSSTTSTAKWNHGKYTFVIQGDDYVYVVSHVLSWRWSKEVQLTVNGPVRYAVEKNKLYLIDENDREFKMKIEKKILREKE
jgi:hypothetical protein